MGREGVVHRHGGLSLTTKRIETGLFVEIWIDLESVRQREVSEKEKGK